MGRDRYRRAFVVVELAAGAFRIMGLSATATNGIRQLDLLLTGAEAVVIRRGLNRRHGRMIPRGRSVGHDFERRAVRSGPREGKGAMNSDFQVSDSIVGDAGRCVPVGTMIAGDNGMS